MAKISNKSTNYIIFKIRQLLLLYKWLYLAMTHYHYWMKFPISPQKAIENVKEFEIWK